jgi:methyl-accepting chemotaxis protein
LYLKKDIIMRWFANLKVLYKISFLAFLLLIATASVGYIGYSATYEINAMSDLQQENGNEVDMGHRLYEQAMALNTTTDELSIDSSKEAVAENLEAAKKAKAVYAEDLPKLMVTADSDEKILLKDIEDAYKAYIPKVDNVFAVAPTIDKNKEEDLKRIEEAMRASEEPSAALQEKLITYVEHAAKSAQEATNQASVTYEKGMRHILVGCSVALLLGLFGSFLIATSGIAKPLNKSANALKELIADNLSIEIDGADRKDEVGDIAKAAQSFKEVLIKNKAMVEAEKLEIEQKLKRQQRVAELISNFDITATETVSTVASASTQLSQTAENMSEVAGNTNQQSIEVASASEQASHNVQSVASAAEEMAATVQEISRQISMSNEIVRQAQVKAEEADNSSRELVDMSKSVGTIATLIEDIAGQINLLALNATIESARSGEAGKGFAVVANEVKNLATQTAKATEQIRQQLDGVQKTAVSVADMLGGVRASIGEVSQSSAAIAAAVEEQSAATHEIVSNMNTATQGVEQINSGIFAIKGGTDSTTAATREVLDAAKMLSAQAEKMDAEVKTFLSNIQAA